MLKYAEVCKSAKNVGTPVGGSQNALRITGKPIRFTPIFDELRQRIREAQKPKPLGSKGSPVYEDSSTTAPEAPAQPQKQRIPLRSAKEMMDEYRKKFKPAPTWSLQASYLRPYHVRPADY